MKLCPCGHAGDSRGRCTCSQTDIMRYRARLSGPLIDRIDLHVTVGAVPVRQLGDAGAGEGSAVVRERVEQARATQRARYAKLGRSLSNGRVPARWIQAHTPIASEARELLATAAERLGLSARSYHRVLRVARTIADLDGDDAVGPECVAEALRYRPVVRMTAQTVPDEQMAAGA